MAAISVSQALEHLMRDLPVMGAQQVPLHEAAGRVLANDIVALRTQPPFAASAMDGYAVRHADCGGPIHIIGEAAAGHPFKDSVGVGQAVRIFTGAVVPDGADTILIQEDASREADTLSATEIPKPGAYVRPAGLDFCEGDVLLHAGTLLDGGHIALAASGNHATLPVVRRPRIGILATGDELRLPGSTLAPGQIIASNSYGAGAVLASYGGEIIDLGIAADTKKALNEKLDAALAARCDVIITLGGASVGDHDLVKPVFEARGMTLDFWKIAMRPGKPLMSGRFGDVVMIGLPGNPVSSLVCAHVFCAPVVAALAGRHHGVRQELALLTAPIGTNGPRAHYMRAIAKRGDKALEVEIFDNQDSSVMSLFAKANCLVIRPPHDRGRAAGEPVTIQWIKTPD